MGDAARQKREREQAEKVEAFRKELGGCGDEGIEEPMEKRARAERAPWAVAVRAPGGGDSGVLDAWGARGH